MADGQFLIEFLTEQGFDRWDIANLNSLIPRDGFSIPTAQEIRDMVGFLDDDARTRQVTPLLANGHGNWIGIYNTGSLRGFICHLDHEETDLTPRFFSIGHLIKAIGSFPEAWDFEGFPADAFDYPSLTRWQGNERENRVLAELKDRIVRQTNTDFRIQTAYAIMALTPRQDVESLYPFLDDDDMYIQERAIRIMGFYKYEPSKEKLISLLITASHNGRLIAKIILDRWDTPE